MSSQFGGRSEEGLSGYIFPSASKLFGTEKQGSGVKAFGIRAWLLVLAPVKPGGGHQFGKPENTKNNFALLIAGIRNNFDLCTRKNKQAAGLKN